MIYHKKISSRAFYFPSFLVGTALSLISGSLLLANPHVLGWIITPLFIIVSLFSLVAVFTPFTYEVWVSQDSTGWTDKKCRKTIQFECKLEEIESITEEMDGPGTMVLKDGTSVKLPTILGYCFSGFKKALNQARPDLFTSY